MDLFLIVGAGIVGGGLFLAIGYLTGIAVTREAVFGAVGPDEGLSSGWWEYDGRDFRVIASVQLAETANEIATWKKRAGNWERKYHDSNRSVNEQLINWEKSLRGANKTIDEQQQTIDDLTVELETARMAIVARKSDNGWLNSTIESMRHHAADCRNQLTDLQSLARDLGDDLEKLAR